MKKWISISVLSIVLLVGCSNNTNTTDNNEAPANTLPRDSEEIKNDSDRDFQGRDSNNRMEENIYRDNGETNNLNENPQTEIIEDINQENNVEK